MQADVFLRSALIFSSNARFSADVSAKLALLSLQHPAGMAIKEKFESVKRLYYGYECEYEGETAMPELLSWDTGRFGG